MSKLEQKIEKIFSTSDRNESKVKLLRLFEERDERIKKLAVKTDCEQI